ncbi:MAG: ankyrin repeat domain-containing protein [SAR324 cluster bacterium]|nr:ankyrin repeat domain-containing protein [SAR324 cluster bacterium]
MNRYSYLQIRLFRVLCSILMVLGGTQTEGLAQPTQDPQRTLQRLWKDLDQGKSEAKFNLGVLFNEEGAFQDQRTALEWFHKAAQEGIPEAAFNEALLLYWGNVYPENRQVTVKGFSIAAEQGLPEAQTSMGFLYSRGYGVSNNETLAMEWYHKAAERGDPQAQFNLGLNYFKGIGIPKDVKEGLSWIKKAAEQNHEVAVRFMQGISKMTETDFQNYDTSPTPEISNESEDIPPSFLGWILKSIAVGIFMAVWFWLAWVLLQYWIQIWKGQKELHSSVFSLIFLTIIIFGMDLIFIGMGINSVKEFQTKLQFYSEYQTRQEIIQEGISFTEDQFMKYVEQQDLQGVSRFLEAGMDLYSLTRRYSPLHKAVQKNNFRLVEQLLSHGAFLEDRDHESRTPLMIAVQQNLGMVQFLVERGANPNEVGLLTGYTSLTWAVISNRPEILEYLLDHGGTRDTLDYLGWGLLHHAVYHQNIEVLQVLVQRGLDLNRQDEEGETPLMIAARKNHKAAANYLMRHGAKLDLKNKKERTALQIALDNRNAPEGLNLIPLKK